MKIKIIFLLLFFTIISCNTTKNTTSLKSDKNHPTFLESDHFGIRVKPILNREYLIFLNWYIHVYGLSYPEKVLSILPKNSLHPDYGSNFKIDEIIHASRGVLKNYILNAKYIDYPLIGLSLPQIMEMQKWMNDRYNENVLIEKGYLNFNSNQKDEDSFSFEAYLVNQYEGSVRKTAPNGARDTGNRIWRKEYLPTFRLPYQDEVNVIKNHKEFSTQLRAYNFDKKDFLWEWNKHFLNISAKENKVILNHHFSPIEIISKDNYNPTSEISNALLNNRKLEFLQLEYLNLGNPDLIEHQYEKYPYPEKGWFGLMDFVVIGLDHNNKPVIADKLKIADENPIENKIYRIAFNTMLTSEYLPK